MENIKRLTKFKSADLAKEFARYLMVGGSAFIVDTTILAVSLHFFFSDLGNPGVLIATAIGFAAGLLYNYILSIIFVFRNAYSKVKGKQFGTFLLFAVIGVIGLLITELGMYIGITLLNPNYYLLIKGVLAGIVLIWNYGARKLLIFR